MQFVAFAPEREFLCRKDEVYDNVRSSTLREAQQAIDGLLVFRVKTVVCTSDMPKR